jgi:membrane protein YdbS with pleckstrin-like domain
VGFLRNGDLKIGIWSEATMPEIDKTSKAKKKTHPATVGKKKKKRVLKESERIAGRRTKNPLAAFVARPVRLKFETQERKEKIILLLRRHWVTNLTWIFQVIFLIFVSFLIPFLPFVSFLPGAYLLILQLVWYLFTFAYGFEKFLGWFFAVNIITDERIIDIDFHNILYKDISETKIDQIQDISVKVGGFARSLFDFGNVSIQTAGAKPEIFFEAVPNPEQVSRVLNELKLEEEQEKIEGRVR